MSLRRILGLVLREAAHRKGGSLLHVLAVAAAVAACVFLAMTQEAAEREARRVTRDLGFNLRIIPRAADAEKFLATGLMDETMSEDVVRRLASGGKVAWNHLVGVLEKMVDVGGRRVILTGLSAEISPPGEAKAPMSFAIEPGTVYAGSAAARSLGLCEGGEVEIAGGPSRPGGRFRVARRLAETGTADDVRLFGHLPDVQRVLGLPGRIGLIQAIDCLCLLPAEDPVAVLRADLERLAPETALLLDRKKADGRALARRTAEAHAALAVPSIVAACGVLIFALAFLNARERAPEIGVLRALGHRSAAVAALFLGRAVLLAVPGALLGYAAGTWIALEAGPGIFFVTAKAMAPRADLLGWSLAGAPLFAALASYVPAMAAVARDPAAVLRGE